MKTDPRPRKSPKRLGLILSSLLILASGSSLQAAPPDETSPNATDTSFGGGQWDKSKWRTLRMVDQATPQVFQQNPDSLATKSFSPEEIRHQQDNALLATRIARPAGEIQATFSVGTEPGATAGIFIAKDCSEDAFHSGTVIFVADNRLAVWNVDSDQDAKSVKYTHLGQLAHSFKVGEQHRITCSFNEKGGIAVSVDGTDVLSFRNCQTGLTIGIWGCHGSTNFFDLSVKEKPSLSPVSLKES